MSYQVLWESAFTAQAAKYLQDDPVGLADLIAVTDALADGPSPPGSVAWGETCRRLHHGRYRVLYRLDHPGAGQVSLINLGQVG
jgi:mRNA interferase RelE/StbE